MMKNMAKPHRMFLLTNEDKPQTRTNIQKYRSLPQHSPYTLAYAAEGFRLKKDHTLQKKRTVKDKQKRYIAVYNREQKKEDDDTALERGDYLIHTYRARAYNSSL